MTFEHGPEPDPDAAPHGDFDHDDLFTDHDDPGDPAAIPVVMYTNDELAAFVQPTVSPK